MKISEHLDCSLCSPLATSFAIRIISPVSDNLLKRIRESTENKPIALFESLDVEEAKKFRRILDWVIDRMELDLCKEAALGPPGCIENNWPPGEYAKWSEEILAINKYYNLSSEPQDIPK